MVLQIHSLELVVTELQKLAHDSKEQADTNKETLERERGVKEDLLSELSQLQRQLAKVTEESNSLQGEIVSLRKQIKDPAALKVEEAEGELTAGNQQGACTWPHLSTPFLLVPSEKAAGLQRLLDNTTAELQEQQAVSKELLSEKTRLQTNIESLEEDVVSANDDLNSARVSVRRRCAYSQLLTRD